MWTTTAPNEPGSYWFYGDPLCGQCGVDFTDNYKWKARTYLVEVWKCANGLIGVTGGHSISLRKFDKAKPYEGYLGYWAKAELPAPPFDSEGYDYNA